MSVHLKHLVVDHQMADAIVTLTGGKSHRVGHHPADGWRCYTCNNRSCAAVGHVVELIPDLPRTTTERKRTA